ncbi:MAG: hypothetical protein KTR31_00770 [Myxococcales bacterium]|nr:hypothetical protein [Myxococcales bacterium]
MISRPELIAHLRAACEPASSIRAAWLGGSDATGRTDEMSDVDLMLVCAFEHVGSTFETVEQALRGLGGVRYTWPVGHPSDADYQQRFYALHRAPEHCMVDLSVLRPDRVGPYLDPTRHGTAVVWFDRDDLLVPTVDPAVAQRRAARIRSLGVKHPICAHLPGKELARGDVLAAIAAYHRILLGPLVELLRAEHCPDRWDFGLRYLDRDVPPDVRKRLRQLALPGCGEELRVCIDTARSWIDALLAERRRDR